MGVFVGISTLAPPPVEVPPAPDGVPAEFAGVLDAAPPLAGGEASLTLRSAGASESLQAGTSSVTSAKSPIRAPSLISAPCMMLSS
jgi:hypothetical protein